MEALHCSNLSTAPLTHTQFVIIHELVEVACCLFMLMRWNRLSVEYGGLNTTIPGGI